MACCKNRSGFVKSLFHTRFLLMAVIASLVWSPTISARFAPIKMQIDFHPQWSRALSVKLIVSRDFWGGTGQAVSVDRPGQGQKIETTGLPFCSPKFAVFHFFHQINRFTSRPSHNEWILSLLFWTLHFKMRGSLPRNRHFKRSGQGANRMSH